ncbi:uncharacterized protein [Antedon mediterranea]|uniref:uncharacterized protein n=1 Tax=Antedon mediterranea TaxID=105859 RepID=UPI003AF62CB8
MCDDVCNQDNSLPCDITNADILYGGLTNMNMLTTYNQVNLTQIAYRSKTNELTVHTRECRAQPMPSVTTETTEMPHYCPDGYTVSQTNAVMECPCTCLDATLRNMSPDGSCQCSCQCADASYDIIAPDGSCPCECTSSDCQTYTIGSNGCPCPLMNDICPPCLVGEVQVINNCLCECVPDDQWGIPPICVNGRQVNTVIDPTVGHVKVALGTVSVLRCQTAVNRNVSVIELGSENVVTLEDQLELEEILIL